MADSDNEFWGTKLKVVGQGGSVAWETGSGSTKMQTYMTAGQDLYAGDIVCIKPDDGKVYQAKSDHEAMHYPCALLNDMGVAVGQGNFALKKALDTVQNWADPVQQPTMPKPGQVTGPYDKKKLDETVPGGAYLTMSGNWVDANGKPIVNPTPGTPDLLPLPLVAAGQPIAWYYGWGFSKKQVQIKAGADLHTGDNVFIASDGLAHPAPATGVPVGASWGILKPDKTVMQQNTGQPNPAPAEPVQVVYDVATKKAKPKPKATAQLEDVTVTGTGVTKKPLAKAAPLGTIAALMGQKVTIQPQGEAKADVVTAGEDLLIGQAVYIAPSTGLLRACGPLALQIGTMGNGPFVNNVASDAASKKKVADLLASVVNSELAQKKKDEAVETAATEAAAATGTPVQSVKDAILAAMQQPEPSLGGLSELMKKKWLGSALGSGIAVLNIPMETVEGVAPHTYQHTFVHGLPVHVDPALPKGTIVVHHTTGSMPKPDITIDASTDAVQKAVQGVNETLHAFGEAVQGKMQTFADAAGKVIDGLAPVVETMQKMNGYTEMTPYEDDDPIAAGALLELSAPAPTPALFDEEPKTELEAVPAGWQKNVAGSGGMAVSNQKVQYLECGMIIDGAFNMDQWLALGPTLNRMRKSILWWIGDWLNFGESKWGEMYAQAAEETGLEERSLANIKSIAKAVPLEFRRPELDFAHHAEIASLMDTAPETAVELLQTAIDEGLTAKQLRRFVKVAKSQLDVTPDAKHYEVCPTCQGKGVLQV